MRATPADREAARMQLKARTGVRAVCVLASPDRELVWVRTSEDLSEIRFRGSWEATGLTWDDMLSELEPVADEIERAQLLLEAQAFATRGSASV